MIDDLIQDTLSWLAKEVPGTPLQLVGDPAARHIDLPCADGSDYRFQLWFYPDGERGITASLVQPGPHANAPGVMFWGWTFELPDFDGSPEKLAHAFERELAELLPAATRIHQRRNWLFWSFRLERQIESTWVRVSGCSMLRATVNVVPIEGQHHVYHAGPVAGAQVGARA